MTTSEQEHDTPRPPDGDWLGTPFLRFTREGAFGVCTLDRPEARNAMTLITGTGDVFAPGGDMGGGGSKTCLRNAVAPHRTAPQARSVVKSSIDNYLGLFDRSTGGCSGRTHGR